MNTFLKCLFALMAMAFTHNISAKEVYGFMTGNADPSSMPIGIYKFNTDEGITMELQQSLTFQLWGGAYADGYYYMMLSDDASGYLSEGLCRYDITSNEIEMGYAYQEYQCSDMTYDYSTSTMYGIMTKNGGQDVQHQLVKINLISGTRTLVAKLSDKVMAIACDYFGNLYAMSASAKLYQMDKRDGSLTLIGSTGLDTNNEEAQSMEFDRATGELYWSGLDANDDAFFCRLDASTGKVIERKQLDNNALLAALYIPFSIADKTAPAKVENLQATTDGNAVTLTWTTPTTTYGGDALTSPLTKIEIERNGQVVNTIDNPTAGQAMQWTDNIGDAVNGKVRYIIYAYNSVGRGEPASTMVAVGEDVPDTVTNLRLQAEGNNAFLSWDAPQKGRNGGTLRPENLQYDIKRNPDGTTFSNITATSFTDTSIATPAYYSYDVSCHNHQGESDAVATETMALGGAISAPYESDFSQALGAAQWRTVDANNDGVTWTYNRESAKFVCYTLYLEASNDSLISVPFRLEKGITYTVKYSINAIDFFGTKEHLRLMLQGSGEQVTLEDLNSFTTNGVEERAVEFSVADSGIYTFAIVALSDPEQWCIEFSGFALTASASTDLAIESMQGNDRLTEGVTTTYNITVANKGTNSIDHYDLTLTDQRGETLATKSVSQAIAPNEQHDVEMEWTPTADINSITATINADGDQQPSNNSATKSLIVIAADESFIEMGTKESTPTIIPFGFEGYTHSYSQTIYNADDTGGKAGEISELMYNYYNHSEAITDRHIAAYMCNSESSSVLDGWIDADDMTKVYDGTASFEGGSGTMRLQLDEPFAYTGGNLCIMLQKIDDATIANINFYARNYEDEVRCALYNADRSDIVLSEVQGSTMLANVVMRFKPTKPSEVKQLAGNEPVISIGHGMISVTSDGTYTITLHDASGRMVAKTVNARQISTSSLSKGVYVISVNSVHSSLKRKVIVN